MVHVAGIGFVLCLGIGFICAVYAGAPPGRKMGDVWNMREHWRGGLQIGVAMICIGLVGQLVQSIF